MEITKRDMLLALLACVLMPCTLAYPDGAPSKACDSMVPKHPKTQTSGVPPYAIKLNQTVYKPGDTISGTLYSTNDAEFTGFLLQARKTGSTTLVGTFTPLDSHTHTVCGTDKKQGLTQSKATKVTSVKFIWTAPSSPAGNFQFNLTTVETYKPSRYWLDISSPVVNDCSLNESLPQCTRTSSLQSAQISAPRTSDIGSLKFGNDPSCGVTKGCFPSDCSGEGCNYQVTWQQDMEQPDSVRFGIKMPVNHTKPSWVSIGMSSETPKDMKNIASSHAAVCMSHGAVGMASLSSFNQPSDVQLQNDLGFSNTYVHVVGGVLECSFIRQKTSTFDSMVNLSLDYHLLVGTGAVFNGDVHGPVETLTSSEDRIHFLAPPVTQVSSATGPLTLPMLKLRPIS